MNYTHSFSVSGTIVDVVNNRLYNGVMTISNNRLIAITETDQVDKQFIIPGFIDSHVHIESSMLMPSEFARLASVHGTVATVSDPHEIANVLGVDGVKFMISNGRKVPFKFFFGAPSCVPATPFETSGSIISVEQVEELLAMDEIYYLSEMMNFPGVLNGDKDVYAKLASAVKYNKPTDGHAPGVKGDDAKQYAAAGITTDHECFTISEAVDKIKFGMQILIREGSAARNFDDLIGLLENHADSVMFCSDDKHPDDLVKGHINLLVKRAVALGYDPLVVLKCCSFNPVQHYKLPVGLLQVGDYADFAIVNDLTNFDVLETYINGVKVAENSSTNISSVKEEPLNIFEAKKIVELDIAVPAKSDQIKVIKAYDGQLITDIMLADAPVCKDALYSDPKRDILKIVVLNRYAPSKPAVAFINGFGFQRGAIASTVAHDSHNIIAVGVCDDEIVRAINFLIDSGGGISLVDGNEIKLLPLSVAGLMSNSDGYQVASMYELINQAAHTLGSKLNSPYMTLSFMALLVIPSLKLSDKGLFDGNNFSFTSVYNNSEM
ncbi:MAG: adenine deaminase [Bacteroidetes bacterium]|nr:adenine deaminase [Bacteroidota bacterium]